MSPAKNPIVLPATPEDGLRIAFLCGCLEAGRDGVGDYTAQLAGECARRGNATLCIALNDLPTAGSVASDGMLRLGSGRPWDVRVEQAREAVEQFRADAVSLQWVPYGFDKRGMPWGIEKGLAAIMRGRVSHVMCHEIWIGAEMGASLKHRLIGAAQREVMRHLFTALRPGCVQTSNGVYGELLKRAGIEAGELPMFGAIPVTGFEGEPEEDVARFGMFGTLHPQWAPEPLLERLRGLGKRIEIEHIGRIGSGEAIWRAMEERYGREIGFKRHGEQPAERVSQFLMSVDFGIATTPLALIGKSATAAAMLEHGLPVIVNRDDVRYAGIATEKPEGVIAMDGDLVEALRTARKRQPQRRLEAAADQFLQCLRRTR